MDEIGNQRIPIVIGYGLSLEIEMEEKCVQVPSIETNKLIPGSWN